MAEQGRPKVSVVIATRERPVLLRRAVQRVMEQRYAGDIECVIVFDQSEPHTPEVEVPAGRTLHVITNTCSPGLAGGRNSGVAAATGEYVAFCDDDDEWMPDKLERQVAAMAAAPDAGVATTGIWVVYEDKEIARVAAGNRITLADLLRSRVMEAHPSTVIFRRDLWEAIGPVDEHIPGSYAEDYEWLLRAARHAPVLALQEPLVVVHWHQSSFFADRWRTIISALTYLVDKHRELEQEPSGLARIYGQIAFAHAALGERGAARRWARRTLSLDRRERRAYLALAVSLRLINARTVVRLAHVAGKGI
jgi:glycosyltransferase involved in cell wall biosynthesis